MDRLGFWGSIAASAPVTHHAFQYPLMDRLGFWGGDQRCPERGARLFQYPLMDRLGFWGGRRSIPSHPVMLISVSADGSTWFLGSVGFDCGLPVLQFQYPLMDRLGFWGPQNLRIWDNQQDFSIR